MLVRQGLRQVRDQFRENEILKWFIVTAMSLASPALPMLPPILEGFLKTHPEVRLRLDIIGSEARMAGLAAGDYELSYGTALHRHERLGRMEFEPMLRAGYLVCCAADHPLRDRAQPLSPEVLVAFSWIKHKFEFDHDPAQWQSTGRTYAMSTNTTLSTLGVVSRTHLLMSTSAISREVFARHKVYSLGPDSLSAKHISGLHILRDAALTSPAKLFLTYCRSAYYSIYGNFRYSPL